MYTVISTVVLKLKDFWRSQYYPGNGTRYRQCCYRPL